MNVKKIAKEITSQGMTLSEDKEWVMDALKFWQEQKKKHPRSKKVDEQLKQFERWSKQFEKSASKVTYDETPDYIRYETDDDIIEVKPTSWELIITEKDSDEEWSDEFETKEEALEAMDKEIEDLENENGDDDNLDLTEEKTNFSLNDDDDDFDYDSKMSTK